MTFSEKLVRLRKIKAITQDEFASAVGVSRQAVYKWESGQSYPEVAKLLEIKLLFGISIDDLLDDNYDIPLPEKKRKKRISKEAKARIEAEVIASMEAEEESEKADEQTAAEPYSDQIVEEASADASSEAQVEEKKEEVKEEKKEKKVGFFSRIFGRK